MVWRTLLTVKSPVRGITDMVRSKMNCMATPTADTTFQYREGVNVPNTRRLKHKTCLITGLLSLPLYEPELLLLAEEAL